MRERESYEVLCCGPVRERMRITFSLNNNPRVINETSERERESKRERESNLKRGNTDGERERRTRVKERKKERNNETCVE